MKEISDKNLLFEMRNVISCKLCFCFPQRAIFLFQDLKKCDTQSIKVSIKKSNIIKRQSLYGKKIRSEYWKQLHIVSHLSRVKTNVTRRNPSKQASIVQYLNTTIATINKIINQYLQHKKDKNTYYSPAFVKLCGSMQNVL